MSRDALEEAATISGRVVRPDEGDEGDKPPPSLGDETMVRPLARPPRIGDTIAEKYRLLRSLGRGGMGRIFAADHLLLGTMVALKFMHPHLAKDRAQIARFAREARAAATLKSQNAARIMDVDQLPTGELYIVMEYLEGSSLEAIVESGQPIAVADAVIYVVQACDALAEAHSRSIVHRDVKPANLFLTKGKSGEPLIKVLDFGLAKSVTSSSEDGTDGLTSNSTATIAGQTMGTPYYMSPEQITGAFPIDGRADVWAIGATLYELLAGRLAFGGGNAAVVFDLILNGKPPSLRALRPDVPESLLAIVDRCLTQDISARFQTVRDLAKALEGSLLVVSDPVPFVAAPLSTDRFVRSSAPPGPLAAVDGAERSAVITLPPSGPSPPSVGDPEPDAPPGPSVGQTVLAALAGPALIGIAAVIVFLVMGRDPAGANSAPSAGVPNKVVYLAGKSGDRPRSKAPPAAVEKPERPPK